MNKIDGNRVESGGRGGSVEPVDLAFVFPLPLSCSNICVMTGGVMRYATTLAPDHAMRAGQKKAWPAVEIALLFSESMLDEATPDDGVAPRAG